MIKILSTKKISSELEKKYKKFFKIFSYDFLEISFLEQKNLENIFKNSENIFIFTSQYAIKSVLENKKFPPTSFIKGGVKNENNLKAFAIEGKTSELVKKAGFEILATGKNSYDLAKKIFNITHPLAPSTPGHLSLEQSSIHLDLKSNRGGTKKNFNLIHLTTKNHLKDMQIFLEKKGIFLETINVYEKKLAPKKIDFEFDGILFFSPSAIESFFKKNILNENVIVFCIGETTKKYFLENSPLTPLLNNRGEKGLNKIIIPEKHSEKNLLETVKNYFKK